VDARPQPDQEGQAGGHRRRRAARRMAIDMLYQADVTGQPPLDILEDWKSAGRSVPEYTEKLVSGVAQGMDGIDRALAEHAEGWAVHRMAVVDRTILRVACYEFRLGLPAAIAISEAVEAAKSLSTEDSGRFINGVLGRIAREPETSP
jgi:N utilization substance protein B